MANVGKYTSPMDAILIYFASYIPFRTMMSRCHINRVAQIAKNASSDTAVASSSCNNIFSWQSCLTHPLSEPFKSGHGPQ